ncbi:MAG: DUF2309 domain-containing protein [Candidatus Obscuribacter phosphatis]|uniref:Probable inorganic carbon transporter subunit DabA n=1 Tax=Candidatus Obscuribacter phosphatis TaxID=1906157 RepID=A0A8J7TJX4_9BACT|nr:DUF2309 domain-containing protein [Candidatus Obscuribacter phosphatis]
MLDKSVKYSDSRLLEVRLQVGIASEILAQYWPIKNFVHHNPLHEMEYLHFEEAVKEAQRLLGGNAYLGSETYRQFYGQGLISLEHIDSVLAPISAGAVVQLSGRTVAKADVLKAHLLQGLSLASLDNILQLVEHSKQRDTILLLAEHLASALKPSDAEADARKCVEDDIQSLTKNMTLSDWCDRTFSTNITQFINNELTKWCGAFVDEGQSVWHLPERKKTLYGTWKSLSLISPCPDECKRENWISTLRALPDSPEDCILKIIEELGISDSARNDYFGLHLGSLPGWAAFLKYRASNPEYPWQKEYPADLTQYLAIRLTLEYCLVNQVCLANLNTGASHSAITNFMSSNPLVYFMLRQRAAGKLNVDLSRKIDRLSLSSGRAIFENLKTIAENYLKNEGETYSKKTRQQKAFQLLELARCLDIPPQELLASDPASLVEALDWLEDFPEEQHGIVWLKAMEADYQNKLVEQLAEAIRIRRESDGADADLEPHQVRPQSQSIFCIDVRSEPFRRHLESVGRNETLGFAGFFICFIGFQSIDSKHETAQFPVIMKARNMVREVPRTYEHHRVERSRAGAALLKDTRALLHNLKEHFITPFVTVEALGWFYSLPFLFKTLAAVSYRDTSARFRKLIEPPVATTLTIDKLSQVEATEMAIRNQLTVIRTALREHFSFFRGSVQTELLEAFRQAAMDEEKPLDQLQEMLPQVSVEKLKAFLLILREEYKIIPRRLSWQLDRITRTGFTIEEQVYTVETALRMMGLTSNFARLIMVCGHGSTSDNNPFESALDCGACGGNEGKANARTFAAMANKIQVREILAKRGIEIPADTYFIPAQINTTTDRVDLLDLEDAPTTHRLDIARLYDDLEHASMLTSAERCTQFPELTEKLSPQMASKHVLKRSADWSQVRPEWGLSGNASFIIARRETTNSISLEGRAFLHSYDYLTDPGGKLLEVIMTAPQVVTQWINMEHYFSGVDNQLYGAGSKVYHNVVGNIGVMAGSSSDLRTGLPWQTVAKGDSLYHQPLRLTTVIEAPTTLLDQIISRHEVLKRFYHGEWVYLIALDRESGRFYKYSANGQWQLIEKVKSAPEREEVPNS